MAVKLRPYQNRPALSGSTKTTCQAQTIHVHQPQQRLVLITIKIQGVLCTRCRNSICCHSAALLATCRQRLALAVQGLALPGAKQNYELRRNQANNREAHPTPSLAHGATWIRTLHPGLGGCRLFVLEAYSVFDGYFGLLGQLRLVCPICSQA